MRSILVLLFVAVAFFATGDALICYRCTPFAKACMDTFDKDGAGVNIVQCPIQSYGCLKGTAQLSNKTAITYRGCLSTSFRTAERAYDTSVVSITEYYCNNDLCNGVSATSATLFTLIVLVVPFIFAKYH